MIIDTSGTAPFDAEGVGSPLSIILAKKVIQKKIGIFN